MFQYVLKIIIIIKNKSLEIKSKPLLIKEQAENLIKSNFIRIWKILEFQKKVVQKFSISSTL